MGGGCFLGLWVWGVVILINKRKFAGLVGLVFFENGFVGCLNEFGVVGVDGGWGGVVGFLYVYMMIL